MTQNKKYKDSSPAKIDSKRKSRLGHWARVAVMFMSGGFIFPHAMNEDMDIAKFDFDEEGKVKKQ